MRFKIYSEVGLTGFAHVLEKESKRKKFSSFVLSTPKVLSQCSRSYEKWSE